MGGSQTLVILPKRESPFILSSIPFPLLVQETLQLPTFLQIFVFLSKFQFLHFSCRCQEGMEVLIQATNVHNTPSNYFL